MRRILLISFLLINLHAMSQVGVKGFIDIPLKGAPVIFGNSFGAELQVFLPFDNEKFMARGSFTFINHSFRFDSIPTYQIGGSNSRTLRPGYTIQEEFKEYNMNCGVDYSFIYREHFNSYFGGSSTFGIYNSVNNESVESTSETEVRDQKLVLGFKFRLGISVPVNDYFEVFGESSYGWKMLLKIGGYSAAEVGMGLRFWINGKSAT